MTTLFERYSKTPKERFIFIGVITVWVYLFFYSTIKIFFEFIPLEDVDSTGYLLYFFFGFSHFLSSIQKSFFLGSSKQYEVLEAQLMELRTIH